MITPPSRERRRGSLSGAAALLALVASHSLVAQSQTAQVRIGSATLTELQEHVDHFAQESGAVGVQVSVILGDERADFVSGLANAELDTPMTADTIVQIGSSTKVLNAALIMTLAEEDAVDLDVPIRTYLPDLELADKDAEKTITLRQVLSMTSGLDNGPYERHGGGDDALRRYIESLSDLPQGFEPGQGFGYSNAGTSIAGYVAEVVTGKTWATLMSERIFGPTGMQHAVSRAQELPFFRVSAGHTPALGDATPQVIRPWYITQAQAPAGSTLAMSAHDLATFGALFLEGGRSQSGEQVLDQNSVDVMMTPIASVPTSMAQSWCVGFLVQDWGGTTAFGHAGGNMSGTSWFFVFPERSGVLALTVNTPAALDAFSTGIFETFGPAVFDAAPSRLAKPESPPPIENTVRYVGRYSMTGIDFVVEDTDGRLQLEMTTGGQGITFDLIPLGDDAFYMDGPAAAGGGGDLAFVGDDGSGRAAYLLAPVFPAARQD